MNVIGEKIKDLRKKNGFSQEDLALKLGVSRQTVGKWESNAVYPGIDNIKEMMKIFNVGADYFFSERETQSEISAGSEFSSVGEQSFDNTNCANDNCTSIAAEVLNEVSKAALKIKKRRLIILSIAVSIIFFISVFIDIILGFSTFITNKGYGLTTSVYIDKSVFYISTMISVLLLVWDIVLIIFIRKTKK